MYFVPATITHVLLPESLLIFIQYHIRIPAQVPTSILRKPKLKMDKPIALPVYLDYNATTPLDELVIEEIKRSLVEDWGNPSSAHLYGEQAKSVIEQSRISVAKMLNANAEDIIFTSGGTEANNVALLSVIESAKTPDNSFVPQVITSNVEHDSVACVLKEQEKLGRITLSTAQVDENGQLPLERIFSLITESTRLVSIMHANNETGVIMPIEELGDQLERINEIRRNNGQARIFLHCDAAQAIGKVKVDVGLMRVDLLTVVGHKFYAPRIGALFVKGVLKGSTPFKHLLHGGGQERGLRPGTENTPMIAGLGKAAQLVSENLEMYYETMLKMKQSLAIKLQDAVPSLKVNFSLGESLPNTLSICLPEGLKAVTILNTNCKGRLLASLGAACHSNTEKPSGTAAVLLASGLSASEASRSIRLSVGRTTTEKEVEIAVKVLREACFPSQT